jgi:hypothetical protein
MTEKISLPFVNSGKEFEIDKMPLGGMLALAKYRAEHPDRTKDELKQMPFDDRHIDQIKLMLAWTVKRKFNELDITKLVEKMDVDMELDEITQIGMTLLKVNFPDSGAKEKRIPETKEDQK